MTKKALSASLPSTMLRKTLFLDRDGTIIVEKDYLRDPAKVELEKGAATGIRRFIEAGYRVVVVSNQSGIGRGYFGEADLSAVNLHIQTLLEIQGASINAWYHCPHTPDEDCSCRKPFPGMLDDANIDERVDWSSSIMVGDKPSDIQAAHSRGVKAFLVLTGYGSKALNWAWQNDVPTVRNLEMLADSVLGGNSA